ncbi:hypothetical protein [Streptococcus ovis]|uniref:hypothetical protein n=1 Tax=Streptococcus ovis TaxID=82806 RepID=UPI000373A2E5|nr:hypothetical protein [Streptococcus ovis]
MTELDRTVLFFTTLEEGRLEEADEILKESYELLESDDKNSLFWLNNNHIYLSIKKCVFQEAREFGNENIRLSEELDNLELKHIALHQLAYIEREAKQYQQALDYIIQEKEIIEQLALAGNDVTLDKAVATYEYAYLNFLLGNKAVAEKEMQFSLKLALQTEDKVAHACAYRGLGEILTDISYLQKARDIFVELGDEYGVREIDELMGKVR